MFIYKITNIINNKIYIGQVYNKSIYDRFARHIKEANPHHSMLIDRAIFKYGKDNFIIEQIDSATSLEELNEKEKYWIKYYNSTNKKIGYNLTLGGDGGNTYLCKTEDELNKIKEKISKANKGKNNAQSKPIKALNVETKEVLHFDTLSDACKHFNHRQKGTFKKYCEHKGICLWEGCWTFAYEKDDFIVDLPKFYNKSLNNGKKVKLIDLETNDEKIFYSIQKLCEYLNINRNKIKFNNNEYIYNAEYRIIKL